MPFPVSCPCCGRTLLTNHQWYVCDKCMFRICPWCLGKHKGKYASSGGIKCSQCAFGMLKLKKLEN
jgi:hypothetical protein